MFALHWHKCIIGRFMYSNFLLYLGVTLIIVLVLKHVKYSRITQLHVYMARRDQC